MGLKIEDKILSVQNIFKSPNPNTSCVWTFSCDWDCLNWYLFFGNMYTKRCQESGARQKGLWFQIRKSECQKL